MLPVVGHITWISKGHLQDVEPLVKVWEASVRASHTFLDEEDIEFYKGVVRKALKEVTLLVSKDKNDVIKGFMGISPGEIDMLFVHPDWFRKGVGRGLVLQAIELHCRKVDVNEQNLDAQKFYTAMGFEQVGRSEIDGYGKPYPILHLAKPDKTGTSPS
ncbi:MAG: GNAT family N-acetyltransferase [Bacteroidales bacterium]|nr:GNAT family N-acetyltransferase [Bacteroidales bacterium]